MRFKFEVKLSDKDYLDYNIFWMLKSPYGKKQLVKTRLIFVFIFIIGILATLILGDGSVNTYLTVGLFTIWLALLQLFMGRFLIFSLKGQLKTMKKSGKMGYSSEAVLEFFEDSFTETTPDNKTEQWYTAVERISVVKNEVIYIHINNVMAYIMPVSCFASEEEYNLFLDFIKTKAVIDTY